MIRIIVRTTDIGAAVHVGSDVYRSYKTFDVVLPKVEDFLRKARETYATPEVIGIELLEES